MHGCQAMTELIDETTTAEELASDVYVMYITEWSDSFLRSYVKQRKNNVWMFTITLPNPSKKIHLRFIHTASPLDLDAWITLKSLTSSQENMNR